MDDDLLLRCARNCGLAYQAWSRSAGRPVETTDRMLLADLGLPVPLPPNSATLLAPLSADEIEPTVATLRSFFVPPGGGYGLWSIWPTPDLTTRGFASFTVPAMVRDADEPATGAPDGLDIERVEGEPSMLHAGRIVSEVFGAGTPADETMTVRFLDDPAVAVWLGRVDGEAVATATSYVSDGFVGIYAVATLPEHRGRGFGAAVTRAALAWRPDLPSTLQASPLGRPVYERMGFRTVATFTVWEREGR